jgi:hypothetical protein
MQLCPEAAVFPSVSKAVKCGNDARVGSQTFASN